MSPTVAEDARGELFMVVGAQGGPRIITAVWQVISNIVDFGFPADAAVAAPRLHHQHLPDSIFAEDEALTREADTELRRRGHDMVYGQRRRTFGAANVITRTASGWSGAVDPRSGGAALGD
jgi:gamma-glutamyltranspeptidase / glutathione hydrolase